MAGGKHSRARALAELDRKSALATLWGQSSRGGRLLPSDTGRHWHGRVGEGSKRVTRDLLARHCCSCIIRSSSDCTGVCVCCRSRSSRLLCSRRRRLLRCLGSRRLLRCNLFSSSGCCGCCSTLPGDVGRVWQRMEVADRPQEGLLRGDALKQETRGGWGEGRDVLGRRTPVAPPPPLLTRSVGSDAAARRRLARHTHVSSPDGRYSVSMPESGCTETGVRCAQVQWCKGRRLASRLHWSHEALIAPHLERLEQRGKEGVGVRRRAPRLVLAHAPEVGPQAGRRPAKRPRRRSGGRRGGGGQCAGAVDACTLLRPSSSRRLCAFRGIASTPLRPCAAATACRIPTAAHCSGGHWQFSLEGSRAGRLPRAPAELS